MPPDPVQVDRDELEDQKAALEAEKAALIELLVILGTLGEPVEGAIEKVMYAQKLNAAALQSAYDWLSQ